MGLVSGLNTTPASVFPPYRKEPLEGYPQTNVVLPFPFAATGHDRPPIFCPISGGGGSCRKTVAFSPRPPTPPTHHQINFVTPILPAPSLHFRPLFYTATAAPYGPCSRASSRTRWGGGNLRAPAGWGGQGHLPCLSRRRPLPQGEGEGRRPRPCRPRCRGDRELGGLRRFLERCEFFCVCVRACLCFACVLCFFLSLPPLFTFSKVCAHLS